MIKYLIILCFFPLLVFAEVEVTLVYDMLNEMSLPAKFRKMNDPLPAVGVNRTGLADLKASGSGQFSDLGLKMALQKINYPVDKILVIDLRDESHGFINGAAVTWYADKDWGNKDLSTADSIADEKKRLSELKLGTTINISKILDKSDEGGILKTAPNYVKIEKIQSEEEVVKAYGAQYHRLRNVDHIAPDAEEVKAFVALVEKLPPDVWIYVHCRGGKGRTTAYLAMIDILRNAKKVSFEEIVYRQFLLGGKDLTSDTEGDGWKVPYFKERIVFLQNFYNEALKR